MAARIGIALDEEQARRVAAGEIGLAALAGELGVARQTLHAAFKRRAWPTTAVALAPAAAASAAAKPSKSKIAAKAPIAPAQRQEPMAAPSQPLAPECLPAGSLAAPAPLPITTPAELAEFARQSVASVAFLVLGQLNEVLASQKLGPAAVKAAAQATQVAAELLERAGIALANEQVEAPAMIFEELTAAECTAIRAQVEAEHGGLFMADSRKIND